jgi:hydroxyacylglutathione hydrolase
MLLFKFACGPLETNAILFGDEGKGAAIDPSLGSAEKIIAQAKQSGLAVEKILLTHSHWDHIADVQALKEKTGALLYVHPLDAKNIEEPGSDGLPLYFSISPAIADHLLQDGEIITVGPLQLETIHTPGHTPGGVCFYLASQGILFAGDTLFCGGMGRLDLPTGNAQSMSASLRKLAKLPPKTRVISGHGQETEIGKETWMVKG